jgi:ABC-type transporter Mla subunit MlaD
MSMSVISNIVTAMLCIAVLVQSIRLMRGIQAVRKTDISAMVGAMEKATAEARHVLTDIKETITGPVANTAELIRKGDDMREELSTLISIADAMAERLASLPKTVAQPVADTPVQAPQVQAVRADEPRPSAAALPLESEAIIKSALEAARQPAAPEAPAARPQVQAEAPEPAPRAAPEPEPKRNRAWVFPTPRNLVEAF